MKRRVQDPEPSRTWNELHDSKIGNMYSYLTVMQTSSLTIRSYSQNLVIIREWEVKTCTSKSYHQNPKTNTDICLDKTMNTLIVSIALLYIFTPGHIKFSKQMTSIIIQTIRKNSSIFLIYMLWKKACCKYYFKNKWGRIVSFQKDSKPKYSHSNIIWMQDPLRWYWSTLFHVTKTNYK